MRKFLDACSGCLMVAAASVVILTAGTVLPTAIVKVFSSVAAVINP